MKNATDQMIANLHMEQASGGASAQSRIREESNVVILLSACASY